MWKNMLFDVKEGAARRDNTRNRDRTTRTCISSTRATKTTPCSPTPRVTRNHPYNQITGQQDSSFVDMMTQPKRGRRASHLHSPHIPLGGCVKRTWKRTSNKDVDFSATCKGSGAPHAAIALSGHAHSSPGHCSCDPQTLTAEKLLRSRATLPTAECPAPSSRPLNIH